ncbi:hypothetical protein ASPACDRAFT_76799 [Aspergillus aculeatus ATCC 16872]|uniref:Uncharacterized protein n=1 Tax=Aspergillus aculeatus (strain ATCC 16872 / CBS 172.66 / WB 5094) TaxID=690307 RepID=A0A1L9X1W5_ASPA1|nr:uncharacterized protein ASPACDRAFT_76799 [Aspergillus aculeatus ATCC 16872]OJK02423.1 hypothetical protein ASPACDRAFT_76799 [Aspergillus aculeatus ATCC 16872]
MNISKPTEKSTRLNQVIAEVVSFIQTSLFEVDKLILNTRLDIEDSPKLIRVLDTYRVRYFYCGSILVIMGECPLNSVVDSLVQNILDQRSTILPRELCRYLSNHKMSIDCSGIIKGKGIKPQLRTKIPDHTITFRHPGDGELSTTIMMETGFSESREDLHRDMLQYFKHYEPAQLVVLLKIKEDKKYRTSRTDPGFRDRAARLLLRFGNDLGKQKHATYLENSAHDASVTADPYTEKHVRKQIKVEDWIGTIEADLELWELIHSEPRLRGGRTRLYPTPDRNSVPYIYAGDLIPLKLHDDFPNLDVSQRLAINTDLLFEEMAALIPRFACWRATKFFRPKDEDEDIDFSADVEEGEE